MARKSGDPDPVKIVLRTELRNIKPSVDEALGSLGFIEVNTNSNLTWLQLFLNHNILEADRNLHVIKNDAGTVVSQMTDSIASYIAKYKKSRGVYTARIVTKRSPAAKVKTPVPKAGSKKKTPSKVVPKTPKNSPKKPGRKKASEKKRTPIRITRPVQRNGISGGVLPNNSSSNQFLTIEEIDDATTTRRFSGNRETNLNFTNGDLLQNMETESQFSIFTQEETTPRDPLTASDSKTAVIETLVKNVSNSMLQKMKLEYEELKQKGKWLRFSTYIPQMAILLNEVFSDNHFKKQNP